MNENEIRSQGYTATRSYSTANVLGEKIEKISPTTFVAELAFTPIQKDSICLFFNDEFLVADHQIPEMQPTTIHQSPFKWSVDYTNGLLTIKFKNKVKGKMHANYRYQM